MKQCWVCAEAYGPSGGLVSTCGHFLHGACVAQMRDRGIDVCYVCTAPISTERERLIDIGVRDVEAYYLVAPLCCKRILDTESMVEIEDRRMHWAPVNDPTSGETTGRWACYRLGTSQYTRQSNPDSPSPPRLITKQIRGGLDWRVNPRRCRSTVTFSETANCALVVILQASRHEYIFNEFPKSAFEYCLRHGRLQTLILDIASLAAGWHFACCQDDPPEKNIIGCVVHHLPAGVVDSVRAPEGPLAAIAEDE